MKNIVFDVDDTIYDQQLPFRQAVEKVFPAVKTQELQPLYIRFRFRSDETFEKVTSKVWSIERMRIYRISEALRDLNYPIPSPQTALQFQAAYENALEEITLHPEIVKLFDFLVEKQVIMGVITNGPTGHQTKKIQQLNLEHWFPYENIIISESVGCQKPAKEIFQLTAERLNMKPSETLYIGDSFENDIVGAKNGGWQSLWFNHRLREIPANELPTHLMEVQTFNQLFAAVQELLK